MGDEYVAFLEAYRANPEGKHINPCLANFRKMLATESVAAADSAAAAVIPAPRLRMVRAQSAPGPREIAKKLALAEETFQPTTHQPSQQARRRLIYGERRSSTSRRMEAIVKEINASY